jgi:hypothetical protein
MAKFNFQMMAVVMCCILLSLISYLFISNNSASTFSPVIARLLAPFEDQGLKGKYGILTMIIILMFLAYNIWVVRVLFGCKRYIADKSKTEMMYSSDAAPRPNGLLPTYSQVQPPPYENNCSRV